MVYPISPTDRDDHPPWNVDDVTWAMSKGVLVIVNVQEWGCFSIFRRADDVTWTMSKGGGACECLHPPPSGNPVSAPVFHPSKFRPPPPTPRWLATGLGILQMH